MDWWAVCVLKQAELMGGLAGVGISESRVIAQGLVYRSVVPRCVGVDTLGIRSLLFDQKYKLLLVPL
jgi:hypothetical protein